MPESERDQEQEQQQGQDATEQQTAVATVEEAIVDLPEAWDRTGDLVVQFAGALEDRWRIAKYIAASGISPDRKPEAVLTKMLYAFELGLPLLPALQGMFYLDGSVGLEGSLMDALAVSRCNVTKEVLRKDVEACEIRFKRPGWDDHVATYTMKEAIRAGLVQDVDDDGTVRSRKNNWRQYPVDMLYWRCTSRGLKVIAPDHFTGIYTVDEVEDVAGPRKRGGRSAANQELDALAQGRDIGEIQPLDEDEMEQLRAELQEAVEIGAIDEERQSAVLEMVVEGRWADVRTSWEGIRGRMLEVEEVPTTSNADDEDEAEQESLL